MSNLLARNWWALALRGVLAILFGVLALRAPGAALVGLVWLFGVYALLDGVAAILSAISHRKQVSNWWVVMIEGACGIATGVLAFISSGLVALALVTLIAAWALVTGVLEMVAAVRLRQEIEGEWMLFLAGLASAIVGVILALFPRVGALVLIWLIAAYSILFGVLMIALALRLHRWRLGEETLPPPSPPQE
jgi:uncharacterized membrane protein HdeD (DUF308 family)